MEMIIALCLLVFGALLILNSKSTSGSIVKKILKALIRSIKNSFKKKGKNKKSRKSKL